MSNEQTSIAITWHNDRADLPKLAALLERPVSGDQDRSFYGLPYALRRTYGAEALPYLEQSLRQSPSMSVRINCARELAQSNQPSGFAFIVDAIENNRSYKPE